MPPDTAVEEPVQRLLHTATGFIEYGSRCWPGADHFLLLEVDADGSCTGQAWVICPACVRQAAQLVLDRANAGGTWLLDLAGEMGRRHERCHLCGDEPC